MYRIQTHSKTRRFPVVFIALALLLCGQQGLAQNIDLDPPFNPDSDHDLQFDGEFPDFDSDDLGPRGAVRELELGMDHSCALLFGGRVKCWGANRSGQLGNGSTVSRSRPVEVANVDTAIDVSAGYRHTCVVLENGLVQCWGSNQYGQLGFEAADALEPVTVPGVEDAVSVTAGEAHTCALIQAGEVLCWGRNQYGQLGDGSFTDSRQPRVVVDLQGAYAVHTSWNHTCAIASSNDRPDLTQVLFCWGSNNSGQVGDGYTFDTNVPHAITSAALSVSAAYSHTCARVIGGSAMCWGWNTDGQLGLRSPDNMATRPTLIPGLSQVKGIHGGRFNTCANLDNGFVQCWGSNLQGELGLGNYRSGPTTRIPYFSVFGLYGTVLSINTGLNHACALLSDRSVVCWGRNHEGQLGDGTTVRSPKPVQVMF